MPVVRIAACQINTVVGDIDGNVDRIIESLATAEEYGADIAVFPELTITGYPPEDLLLKPGFVAHNLDAMRRVADATNDTVAIFGFVDRDLDLYNAAAIAHGGEVHGRYHKRVLPNYGVFDEQRYFASGHGAEALYGIAGVKVGVVVCEDAWAPNGPIAEQTAGGAELIIDINASPFYSGRVAIRERMLATRAADNSVPLVYVNQVGGQDELVFDGGSLVMNSDGEIIASAPQFVEEMMIVDVDVRPAFRKRLLDPRGRAAAQPLPVVPVKGDVSNKRDSMPIAHRVSPSMTKSAEIYNALVLGTRDYVTKNGFTDVVVGLSGGIDSTLVATIAVDALGADRVHGISMPSRYSSDHSVSDAKQLADNLGIEMRSIPIEEAHSAFGSMLKDGIGETPTGLTDENLQSRIRGVTAMALSNYYGWLVLTTGNKSELAVGYSTLYGDTAGGFSVIKDVVKTTVYELCRWRNEEAVANGQEPPIPEKVITKPPSAELRPDQRDDESLPPYEVLDPILELFVEQDMNSREIVAQGFDHDIVARVLRMVDLAEYKRRQSPIGVRVTPKAFGKDRRVPITNAYR